MESKASPDSTRSAETSPHLPLPFFLAALMSTALASMVAPETRVAALAMAARAKVAIEKRILTVRGRL
ncbi:hypothetical protein BDV98DRAFT_578437 [Pterulicium gracile]|uniref:Uncharacterized protein n=1 Tax=Pterulicium gracile TaxID=1884261 RepID=A0A5C3Q0E1_9AGAR|nr:hypothetical protein BDV98DRAFT_578439 [Pterula gracilis]TFK95056.1 hypothetical protein BDV98DRAFT_578437 [Pterula gracilis]